MHPIFEDRRGLALYLLAWCCVGALLTIGLGGASGWTTATAFFVPLSVMYAFVALSAWYVCRAFPAATDTRRWWNATAAHALAAVAAAAMWVGGAWLWAQSLDTLFPGMNAQPLFTSTRVLLAVVGILLFWLASAGHYVAIAVQASRDAEKRAIELTLLAREAELTALRAQVDPHFIFNSLHSISALTTTDPASARRMCLLLADFLRDTLRLGAHATIALADELALADRFLAIEQVRLGSRLHITRDTDADANGCLVPALMLQPLVENAVVHGVAQLIEGGTIALAARRHGGTLTITLENPCDPDRPQSRGAGLGLDLLRRRLAAQFGVVEAVHAAEDGGSFRVEVRIPALVA